MTVMIANNNKLKKQLKKCGLTIEEFRLLLEDFQHSHRHYTDEMVGKLIVLLKKQQLDWDGWLPKSERICFICGENDIEKLLRHHVRYSPQSRKITLCHSCHGIFHKIILNGKKIKNPLKRKGRLLT